MTSSRWPTASRRTPHSWSALSRSRRRRPGLAYEDIAPLLWLRAGGSGPIAQRTDDAGDPLAYAWTRRYGILFDEDKWRAFVSECPDTATAAFIVTNSSTTFAGIVAELPTNLDTVRLYDTYLSMFQPDRSRRLMRYELRDYQRDAVTSAPRAPASRTAALPGYRSSFALSAITGSGKTVIATAVIEALFFGSTDLGAEADPKLTVLWITDDPALNRQTRGRMLDASERLTNWQLREVDESFRDEVLSPGRVYFLNTQKLSRSQPPGAGWHERPRVLVLGHPGQHHPRRPNRPGDGAGRGASGHEALGRPADDRASAHQWRAWVESADAYRLGHLRYHRAFDRAMGEVTDRTKWPNVVVDIERVRASGLVKDEIGLDQPDEKGTFSTTLLREAVKSVRSYEQRWAAYSAAEGEPQVLPVLVVQVPDKASNAKLTELVSTIEEEWPDLNPQAIAHVLGEHETLTLGSRTVEWVYPESIQTDTDIRVVLAKEAISTGWDCPRAEVLYSERPAKDATHIAQIIGRMVRQPLAHRIATDDALNSVQCYLPLFDRKALTAIKDALEGTGPDNGQHRVAAAVVRAPQVFNRNPNIDPEVFEFVDTFPPSPRRTNPQARCAERRRSLTCWPMTSTAQHCCPTPPPTSPPG